jgi:hypothetical protein
MTLLKTVIILMLFVIIVPVDGISAQKEPAQFPDKKHSILISPAKFVGPEDNKVWEGEIEGRVVAYFRLRKARGVSDAVVVTRDDLPEYFKRIEYLDRGGDGTLDAVLMKVYEKAKGWRDAGITKDNKYGIGYADTQYKELWGKIKKARAAIE